MVDSAALLEFIRQINNKSLMNNFSMRFLNGLKELVERFRCWQDAIKESLIEEQEVKVLDSEFSEDEQAITLRFYDIIDD